MMTNGMQTVLSAQTITSPTDKIPLLIERHPNRKTVTVDIIIIILKRLFVNLNDFSGHQQTRIKSPQCFVKSTWPNDEIKTLSLSLSVMIYRTFNLLNSGTVIPPNAIYITLKMFYN